MGSREIEILKAITELRRVVMRDFSWHTLVIIQDYLHYPNSLCCKSSDFILVRENGTCLNHFNCSPKESRWVEYILTQLWQICLMLGSASSSLKAVDDVHAFVLVCSQYTTPSRLTFLKNREKSTGILLKTPHIHFESSQRAKPRWGLGDASDGFWAKCNSAPPLLFQILPHFPRPSVSTQGSSTALMRWASPTPYRS